MSMVEFSFFQSGDSHGVPDPDNLRKALEVLSPVS
jgi:hypothetical protein